MLSLCVCVCPPLHTLHPQVERVFEDGEVVVRQSEKADSAYIVTAGFARVTVKARLSTVGDVVAAHRKRDGIDHSVPDHDGDDGDGEGTSFDSSHSGGGPGGKAKGEGGETQFVEKDMPGYLQHGSFFGDSMLVSQWPRVWSLCTLAPHALA